MNTQRIYYGKRVSSGDCEVTVVEANGQCRALTPARSLTIRNHSPTGFEWGYGGSGPAQLSLALLLDYFDEVEIATQGYMEFKGSVTCRMPKEWELTAGEIQFWMQTSLSNKQDEAHAYFSAKWEGARQEQRQ